MTAIREKTLRTLATALLAAALYALAGCLTPERAEREADEAAVELATACWQTQTGLTNAFDITRPRDVFTLRVALEAVRRGETNAVFPSIAGVSPLEPGTNGLTMLSLDDALKLGARNNRDYQTKKELVYRRALSLDTARHEFETSFSGMVLGALSGNPEIVKETASAGGDPSLVRRKFEQGAVVAGNMAIDVARMIRDDWHSFAWTGDLTMSVPLLRGAGRDIVREPLTQAERDLAYALFDFHRYRETYALSVARAYFTVLRYAQNHRNSGDNARRLEQNWQRAEMMFKAGRMDRIQMDQARTDLLNARQAMITTQQSYGDALDSFKMTLGLAPEAPVALRDEELADLERRMSELATGQPDALGEYPSESAAMGLALAMRTDLAIKEGDVADAERKARVAADALLADVTVEGGVKYDASRSKGSSSVSDSTETQARLKFSAPWDRRRERNAYRAALIDLDQARRAEELAADDVKNEVRSGYRDLAAARVLYENKVEALKVAQMRVDSNDLFMQSGRSSMRDILEAEAALLTARNALCSAVIDWWTSDLKLKCAMGALRIDREGTWSK